MDIRIRSTLAWLIMATFCGLIGFAIIYYYATNDRPTERFAIVIDAGSTQTRSNLFKITIDLSVNDLPETQSDQWTPPPLGQLVQVQQVSSCINGGPLASIPNEWAARDLIKDCLVQFSEHIKTLDFIDMRNKLRVEDDNAGLEPSAGSTESPDADNVIKQMALMNHRLNSITHMHLGATAGMRALEQMNATRASERLAWIDRAIRDSNEILSDNSPYINKGYVGILAGSDEASFGWVSVNFVCDSMRANSADSALPSPQSVVQGQLRQNKDVIYQLDDDQSSLSATNKQEPVEPVSVGTLELGGASAQMAFKVANNLLGTRQIQNISLEEQQLDLFNGHYKLATRSDLCLGMSQAVLRLNYVLLHRFLSPAVANNNQQPTGKQNSAQLKVVNACMQRGATLKVTGPELTKLWQGACLAPSTKLSPGLLEQTRLIRAMATSKESIEFLGSGDVDQCSVLLDGLVQPTSCERYFSLCPSDSNRTPPPPRMPFVTISGYNHALNVLNLSPSSKVQVYTNDKLHWDNLNQAVEEKLGGSSINYDEFVRETREYCSTDLNVLLVYYPKVNKRYQNIICLQLVYIRKLLVEFYRFDPVTNWSQIKFLIFTPSVALDQYTKIQPTTTNNSNNHQDIRPDIGWTLGLLLNATSQQLSSGAENEIYYHHGSSVMYMIRATILIMLACFLVAIALLVIGIVEVRRAQARGDAYLSHSSSSYDVSNRGETITSATESRSINTSGYIIKVQQNTPQL